MEMFLKCSKCCSDLDYSFNASNLTIEINPCETCVDKAYDTGHEEGAKDKHAVRRGE